MDVFHFPQKDTVKVNDFEFMNSDHLITPGMCDSLMVNKS